MNNQYKPEDFGIVNYSFDEQGFLNVRDDVSLHNSKELRDRGLTELPFKFGKIFGHFDCSVNDLTSLTNAPYEVGGSFYCYGNKLKNLEGCPEIVNTHFVCSNNLIETLKYHPKKVGGDFCADRNPIRSLDGFNLVLNNGLDLQKTLITKVDPSLAYFVHHESIKYKPEDFHITEYKFNEDGSLDVFQDVDLMERNLYELPFNFNIVNGDFNCCQNELVTLRGSPKKVLGKFDCSGNKIKSLQYSPRYVKNTFNFSYNKISNLKFLSKMIKKVDCRQNKIKSLEGCNPRMKMLDCSYNLISSLKPLKKVNVLHIEMTIIQDIPESLKYSNIYWGYDDPFLKKDRLDLMKRLKNDEYTNKLIEQIKFKENTDLIKNTIKNIKESENLEK